MAKYVYEVHITGNARVEVEADGYELDKNGNLELYIKPENTWHRVAQFATGVWQYWQCREKDES